MLVGKLDHSESLMRAHGDLFGGIYRAPCKSFDILHDGDESIMQEQRDIRPSAPGAAIWSCWPSRSPSANQRHLFANRTAGYLSVFFCVLFVGRYIRNVIRRQINSIKNPILYEHTHTHEAIFSLQVTH